MRSALGSEFRLLVGYVYWFLSRTQEGWMFQASLSFTRRSLPVGSNPPGGLAVAAIQSD